MKTIVSIALCAAAIAAGSFPARAQVPGQYTGAQTLPVNGHLFGAYLSTSNNVVGLLTQLRLSFYPGVDFGFQGGLARLDYVGGDRTTLRLGTDLKVAMRPPGALPVAFALGGALGVETGDDYNLFTVGPNAVLSRAFRPGQAGGITAFAGAGLMFTNIDAGALKDTDFSVPLRIGGEIEATSDLHLTAELQLRLGDSFNDDIGVSAGVNLPF